MTGGASGRFYSQGKCPSRTFLQWIKAKLGDFSNWEVQLGDFSKREMPKWVIFPT